MNILNTIQTTLLPSIDILDFSSRPYYDIINSIYLFSELPFSESNKNKLIFVVRSKSTEECFTTLMSWDSVTSVNSFKDSNLKDITIIIIFRTNIMLCSNITLLEILEKINTMI